MSTISMRVNEEELLEIQRVVAMASKDVSVSRHKIMKAAMMRGLRELRIVLGADKPQDALGVVPE